MLREFRGRETAELLPLLERHFPEENALLGWEAATYHRLIRRFYRWDFRFVLALLALFGRPIYRFFVIEADGHLVATALLSFTRRAGIVSTVLVDTPYRRRGYAKRLLEAAREAARRRGRRFLVLDVLSDNAPALALYRARGFTPLRRTAYLVRDRPAERLSPDPAGVRPFRPRDADALAEVAQAQLPPSVAEALPADPGQFALSAFVTRALEADTEAWVVPSQGPPKGFVRATVSRGTEAGNLIAPVLGDPIDPALARRLVRVALDWIDQRGAPRTVCEVADHNVGARRALEAEGFREALRVETLALPL